MNPGGALLLFTDGLTDSIPSHSPELLLCKALAKGSGATIVDINSLVDPVLSGDDITILLVKRIPESASETVGTSSLQLM